MQRKWSLHYPRWMIGDGEPDRAVGEVFDWFALEFWAERQLERTTQRIASATAGSDYEYRVVAEVTHLSEKTCVIDFGLRATGRRDYLPPECVLGDYVSGQIKLELPLCTPMMADSVLDNLKHRWRISKISADMTPFHAHPDNPRFFTRDDTQIRYEEVPSTESVTTEMYVLHCSEDSA